MARLSFGFLKARKVCVDITYFSFFRGVKATPKGLSVVDSIISKLLLHLDGINRTVLESETY